MSFGLQNQPIRKTPTGRIDSAYLDGNDGSGVAPSWNATTPDLTNLTVGTAFTIDLIASGFLTDPGSPDSDLGFNYVSGQRAVDAGFSFSGPILSNPCTVATSGAFRLVALRNNVSVLGPVISFVVTSTGPVADTVAPTIPTGITAIPGSSPGTISLSFDAPCDVAPPNSTASGVTHVDVLINGQAASSPTSPIVTPANALAQPTIVNVGAISSPNTPTVNQSGKAWQQTAAGSALVGTATEQFIFTDFGTLSGAQKLVARLDAYTTGGAANTAFSGIIIHETAAQGGRLIALGLRPSDGTAPGLYLIVRTTTSSTTSQVATKLTDQNGQTITGPVDVKLERAADGKTFTANYSLDERNWLAISTQTITMATSVHYGLALSSQSAGNQVTATIEEVALSNTARVSRTINSTVSVALQLQAVDGVGNTSALSTSITGVPAPPVQPGTSIIFKPGIRVKVAGYSNMKSLATYKAAMDDVISKDVNNKIRGLCISPTWAQLEGPSLGQYDSGIAAIAGLVSLLKSYSPPRDLSIFLNCSGNGSGGVDGGGFVSSFCPSYMNSATYDGGMFQSAAAGIKIKVWNANVVTRLAALFSAYYQQFGPDTNTGGIYRWDPFQEISWVEGAGGYTFNNLLSVWPALMAGMRNAAPQWMIFIKPTFINPNTGASYPTILNEAFKNHISMGEEDTGNNTTTQISWGMKAYLGQWASTPVNHTTANGGNPDWDYHCNLDPAELFQESSPTSAVPPATVGSGTLYDLSGSGHPGVWTKMKALKASHIDVFTEGWGGPNVNSRSFRSGAPANPTPGPGAGLVAARPNLIDVLTGNTAYSGIVAGALDMPWTQKPPSYP